MEQTKQTALDGVKRMIDTWRDKAGGHYCQTYNRGMAEGLYEAANELEAFTVSLSFDEAADLAALRADNARLAAERERVQALIEKWRGGSHDDDGRWRMREHCADELAAALALDPDPAGE